MVDNGSGSPRFTGIMVPNTSAHAKAWGWLYNASTTADDHLVAAGHRLVALEQYTLNGSTFYACVLIANSGRDARAWAYDYGLTGPEVTH